MKKYKAFLNAYFLLFFVTGIVQLVGNVLRLKGCPEVTAPALAVLVLLCMIPSFILLCCGGFFPLMKLEPLFMLALYPFNEMVLQPANAMMVFDSGLTPFSLVFSAAKIMMSIR
ncbi:MAG: hypothetical protein PHQ23_16225, partial [Candidatus Wallbacteria bacterium]|nr:hypothetical protein [Candidatus Wallbacteria bacterium]